MFKRNEAKRLKKQQRPPKRTFWVSKGVRQEIVKIFAHEMQVKVNQFWKRTLCDLMVWNGTSIFIQKLDFLFVFLLVICYLINFFYLESRAEFFLDKASPDDWSVINCIDLVCHQSKKEITEIGPK